MKANLEFTWLTSCCNSVYPANIPTLNEIGCNFCGLEYEVRNDYEQVCICGEPVFLKITDSGVSHNHYWGQDDHWFVAEGDCTACGFEHYVSDGSL